MPLLPLIVLGVVAMAGLATLRVLRVHQGRTPLPDGRGRRLFLLGFVVIPPVLLGALTQTAPPANQLSGLGAVPTYVVIIGALAILMWIASQVVGVVAHGPTSRLVRVALAGHEGDPYAARVDAPVTANLAESVVVVDRANAAFPRGAGFPSQVSRVGLPGRLECARRRYPNARESDRGGLPAGPGGRVHSHGDCGRCS